jgi:endonuclease III
VAHRDNAKPTKVVEQVVRKYWKMKNTKIKFKPKVKVTGRVKTLIASMLSAVLSDFVSTKAVE